MRSRFASILVCSLLGLLAGCQSGDVIKRVPVAGGGEIMVPLTRDGLKPGSADGYEVAGAMLEPGKETRDAFYSFALVAKHAPALKRIQVDDISDETAVTLVDDRDPQWKDRRWTKNSEIINADDPRMKWVYQITPAMRVYHFTLTRNDGTQVSFNHVQLVPPVMKAMIRNRWGEKY